MQTFRTVWLLRYLSLGGELCLRDGTNATFFFMNSQSLVVAGKHEKRHAIRAHKPYYVSDWLKPDSCCMTRMLPGEAELVSE